MCCRRLVSERGAPLYLRSDNGPEFVSRALLTWITGQGIDTAFRQHADSVVGERRFLGHVGVQLQHVRPGYALDQTVAKLGHDVAVDQQLILLQARRLEA